MGLSRQGLVQDGVDGIEEVSSDFVEAFGASLGYLDEVINEDISGSQGLVERPVGGGRDFVRLRRERLDPREGLEDGVGFGFLGRSGPWVQGHLVVILGSGFVVESVWWSGVVGADGLVGKVAYGLGHGTEGRG